MKMKPFWLSWLYMFILCAVLGFIPEPTGFFKILLALVAAAFFVPGFVLLTKADHRDDEKTIRIVRNIAIAALVLAVGLILLNFASVLMSKAWGIYTSVPKQWAKSISWALWKRLSLFANLTKD